MKCPNCAYEPTMREITESADSCPKCGTNYQEYSERQASQSSDPMSWGNLSKLHPEARNVVMNYKGASPVVVIDFKMGFWSMVFFMVKASIAAIPAIIIVSFIVAGLFAVFGGFLAGLSSLYLK